MGELWAERESCRSLLIAENIDLKRATQIVENEGFPEGYEAVFKEDGKTLHFTSDWDEI